jgi:DUF1680 family protein
MRAILIFLAAATALSAAPITPDYPITPVPLTGVRITDHFWAPKIDVNRTVTIPHIMRQNEVTGRVDNFLKAAHAIPGEYKGHRYDDTDVYKVIEAASYSLAAHPDPVLARKVDELIALVAKAQEPDGYIYSARTANPAHPAAGAGPERWTWLSVSHELYNQGHLYEAAVAHYQATGKRTLLDVALKSADLVCAVFGPNGRHDAPGHEEVELALVKLYRVTGNRKYLDTATFFLDQRGRTHTDPPHEFPKGDPFDIYNSREYRQDDRPIVDQTRAEGHAVRATYLYNALTDVAMLDTQAAFGSAVDRLWDDVVSKRMYLTGGLGSVGRTEAFGDDYVLPNRAYAETCASVGGLLWYHRMFLREGDGKYYDTFERTLYNGYLSGVSLAGDSFFYQNPLVSDGRVERSKYFDVACCPANLARLMGQLSGLIYAHRQDEVYVNLYIGSDATFDAGGTRLHIVQTTEYPWNGRITLRIDPEHAAEVDLALRIPGWARGQAMPSDLYRFANAAPKDEIALTVNGTAVSAAATKGYAHVRRRWKKGDVVQLDLPMPVRRVVANDAVAEDRGRAAIQRGPVVYCLEGIDNGGHALDAVVPLDEALSAAFKPGLLGGVDVITGRTVTAVPYYAWNNRGKGEMVVWVKTGAERAMRQPDGR